MFRTILNAAGGLLGLGTNGVVLDRTTGNLHYRDAAGVSKTLPAERELILMVTAPGGTGALTVSVLRDTIGMGAVLSAARSGTGVYQINLDTFVSNLQARSRIVVGGSAGAVAYANRVEGYLSNIGGNGSDTYLGFETRNAAGTLIDAGAGTVWLLSFYRP